MSNPFAGYADRFNEEVRLVILRALSEEPDGRLNESMIQTILETFAINRSREFLRTQLEWLEREAQAVSLKQVASVYVVELTEQGENHVQRKALINGVKAPSRRRA